MQTYNETCRETPDPGPLNQTEKNCFAALMAAANLLILNWTVTEFYAGDNPDIDTLLKYLVHGLKLMVWIEAHKDRLASLVL